MLIPIVLRGDEFPQYMREITRIDLRKLSLQKSTARGSTEMHHEIIRVAKIVAESIDQAPPFDPGWSVLSESVYQDKTPARAVRRKRTCAKRKNRK